MLSLAAAIVIVGATLAAIALWASVYACWAVITLWVWALAIVYLARYRRGKWRSMRVIDQTHHGAGRPTQDHERAAGDGSEFAGAAIGEGA